MIKFFFNVEFQYRLENGFSSTFNIGYFTTRQKAIAAIDFCKNKPGFIDFEQECFNIYRIGVRVKNDIDKEKLKLFVLTCEKEIEGGTEWTDFGAFSSREIAMNEMKKQKGKKHYTTAVFNIDEWIPNKHIEWVDGFDKIKI